MGEFFDRFQIREAIKQHDRYQFETRFDYSIDPHRHNHFELRNKKTYYMDAYFFIPKLMGINVESYKKSHFYEDIRPLLRFKEPHFSHSELLTSKPGKESPFARLEYLLETLANYNHSHRIEIKNEAIDLIKYFACCFVSNFRRKVRKRCRAIAESAKNTKITDSRDPFVELDPFLRRYFSLLRQFSGLRTRFSLPEDLRDGLVLEMVLAEEYCFYRFREGVALAVETVEFSKGSHESYIIAKRKLRVWSRFINWFEHSKNFVSVSEKSSTWEREGFLSRLGNIKKHLSRVLYLDVKPNRIFAIRSQIGYMIAAALAAFWYFVANLIIFSYFRFGGFGSVGDVRDLLGVGSIAVIFSFIVAYVLKDRIKEIGRVKFKSGIFGKTPDFMQNFHYENSMGVKTTIGKMSESVEFIRKRDAVPSEIRMIRDQRDVWNEEGQIDILLYQKKIELDQMAIRKIRPEFFSVKHIIRFSIRRFLTKLDDPVQMYLGLDKKGTVQEIGMPKVYYIGVAITYRSEDRKGPSGFDYQVLVVDKNGLVRIDEIARSMRTKN